MSILSRYLIGELIKRYILMAFVLSVFFSIFILSEQIKDVEGDYSSIRAFWYVGMTAPGRLFELAPFVALFGTQLAFSNLSRCNELTAILTAGYTPGLAMRATFLVALCLLVFSYALAQWVVPKWSQQAELQRMTWTAKQGLVSKKGGFWIREGGDFLHVRKLLPGGQPAEISIYAFDSDGELDSHTEAAVAVVEGTDSWRLQQSVTRKFRPHDIDIDRQPELPWTPIVADIGKRLYSLPLATLSYSALHTRIGELRAQGFDAGRWRLTLWQKLTLPLSIPAMAMIALPFGFSHARGGRSGKSMAKGMAVGICYYLLLQVLLNLSVLWSLPPIPTSLLPVTIASLMAWTLTRRLYKPG